MNKTTTLVIALVLAMSSFFTAASYAGSHEEKSTDAEMECVTQAALNEMSEDDKAKLTEDMMCEGDEGDEKDEEKLKTE